MHWDGNKFSEILEINSLWGPYWIEKIWESPNHNVYVVGDGGSVVKYDGSSWKKVSVGTTLNLYDVWGPSDSSSGSSEVLAVGNDIANGYKSIIIAMDNNGARTISEVPINYPLNTVWFIPCKHYYVGGGGLYEKHDISDPVWKINPIDYPNNYVNSIRGNSENDVFAAGDKLRHYNGINWQNFPAFLPLTGGQYSSVAIKGNLLLAVGGSGGLNGQQAIILIGNRPK